MDIKNEMTRLDNHPLMTSNRRFLRKIKWISDDRCDGVRAYKFRKILWWSFIGFIQTNILRIKQ